MKRASSRKGAGRPPKYGQKTKPVRVPVPMAENMAFYICVFQNIQKNGPLYTFSELMAAELEKAFAQIGDMN